MTDAPERIWAFEHRGSRCADDKNFTHWMPLPAPPRGETK